MTKSDPQKRHFVGPVQIPLEYRRGLERLKKPHVTFSDLIREGIYLLLKDRGIIKDE